MIESYLLHLSIIILIYLILALSLQITLGYTGLLNLGHIAFFGIGAYLTAILTLNGVNFIFAIFLSAIVTMLIGMILSYPVSKLKGDYLALATMGFAFVMVSIFTNWTSLTNGPIGLANIPSPNIIGLEITSNLGFFILTLLFAVLIWFVLKRIIESPFGKVLEAVRDNELTTKIIGKNTIKMKAYAFGISAFFASIAGGLYAHYITYINPTNFNVVNLIPILAIVIIGGLASFRGTIITTIVLVLLPEPLRFIGFPSALIGPMRQFIFALILLLILMYKPKGLFGKVEID